MTIPIHNTSTAYVEASIPEWATTLVDRIDLSVLRTVLEESNRIDLPLTALDAGADAFYAQSHNDVFPSEIYRAINNILIEELGDIL